jgi:hypothetical protein
MALASTGLAFADNVVNDVDVAVGDNTIVAGGSTTIGYKINATGGDGQKDCNASDGSPVKVTLSVPDGVTATASQLTFSTCGEFQQVSFGSSVAGSYRINVSSIQDIGAGSYGNQANWTLNVSAANTKPYVSVSGVTDGAEYKFGSVPTATCDVTDTEEGPSSFNAALSGTLTSGLGSQTATCDYTDKGGLNADTKIATYTIAAANTAPDVSVSGVADGSTYEKSSVPQPGCSVVDAEDSNESATPTITNGAYDALGSHTATCSYTDGGDITRSAQATYTVVRDRDTSAPVITKTVTGTLGQNGWYTSDVTLDWTVTENESPETLDLNGCSDVTVSADQAATNYSCSASSEGGNAAEQTVSIKRDGTAPTVSYTSASGTVVNNWYTTPVTATFTGTDDFSGPASATDTVTSDIDGAAVTLSSPAFSDNAGNTRAAGAASHTFAIDTKAPTNVQFVGGPAAGSSYVMGSVPAAPTCSADDATSSVATCDVTGYSSAAGTHTMTATATDNAGHSTSVTRTYMVTWTSGGFYSPVDMGGALNTVKGGSTVPLKFELFAGATGVNELTATEAVKSFTTSKINCSTLSGAADEIEVVSTGGTSLRYDTTGGQFIQNWKTPTGVGCYKVTMTAADGLTTLTAYFKTR